MTVKEQVGVRAIGRQCHVNPLLNVLCSLEIVGEKRPPCLVVLPHHHEATKDVVGAVIEGHTVLQLQDGASRGERFNVHPKRHRVGFAVPEDQLRCVVQTVLEQRIPVNLEGPLGSTKAVVDERQGVVVDGLVAGCVELGGSVKIRHQRGGRPIRHLHGTRPVVERKFGREGVAQLGFMQVNTGQRRGLRLVRTVHRSPFFEVRSGRGGQHKQGQQRHSHKTSGGHDFAFEGPFFYPWGNACSTAPVLHRGDGRPPS